MGVWMLIMLHRCVPCLQCVCVCVLDACGGVFVYVSLMHTLCVCARLVVCPTRVDRAAQVIFEDTQGTVDRQTATMHFLT